MLAGRADLDLAHQLITCVGVGRDLVTEVGLAVLFGPARIAVLLAALDRPPLRQHRAFDDHGFLFLAQRLLGRLDYARVDHLSAARNVAVLGQLPIHRLEGALADAGLDQPFLEGPDRRSVGNLAARAQSGKALKAQAVEQLELHLLVAQVEQLLDQ